MHSLVDSPPLGEEAPTCLVDRCLAGAFNIHSQGHQGSIGLLTYVTIRPGVVAESGAGSKYANRKSVQEARG